MKKKIMFVLTFFTLLLSFFTFSPIISNAAEENPCISEKKAVDMSSNQLVDGKGYFEKIDNSTYYFYYTYYLNEKVNYKNDESKYVKKISRVVTPSEWYNALYGLDLDNFEYVLIINGKWALPYEYAKDDKGVIIPESTGYLEESIYSDCRRYVYYLVKVNEDGVQRPDFNRHYECDIQIKNIPSYLLNDGVNEKLGIHLGKIYNTSLLTYKAVRNISYYVESKVFVPEHNDINEGIVNILKQKYGWRPIIYFNIHNIDYDQLLSVKYTYKYAEYKQSIIGFFSGEYDKLVEDSITIVEDEVFFDESFDYIASSETPLFVNDNFSNLLLFGNVKDFKAILKNKEFYGTQQMKNLEQGNWNFDNIEYRNDDGILIKKDAIFKNRIVGHSFSSEHKKMFRLLKENNSVRFCKITYTYDGVLYASDDNVPIQGENLTPDSPTTEEILNDIADSFFESVKDFAGSYPSVITNSGIKVIWDSIIDFFKNLSPLSIFTLIFVVIVILLIFTRSFWIPLLRSFVIKNPAAYDESRKISTRNFYTKKHKKERKELISDRKHENAVAIRNKVFEIDTRNNLSNRTDKKYEHEENIQILKNTSFEKQHEHEKYMQEQEFKENAKKRRFWNKKNTKPKKNLFSKENINKGNNSNIDPDLQETLKELDKYLPKKK